MKQFLLTTIALIGSLSLLAQAPTIHPLPGGVTWCPSEEIQYDVQTTGAQQTACKYLWTVTNGAIISGEKTRVVTIKWNDSPEKGTLSVTLTECTKAENTTKSEDYVIRSVKELTPQNLITNPAGQALCGTTSVYATVAQMYVPNTSSLLQVYPADGCLSS